jgi:hypothetical protein
MSQQKKAIGVSEQSINNIYDAFTTNHLIQCAFKTRLSQLNIKKATIAGSDITPEDQKTFLTKWVHPLIFDVASMLCMFGAIQFKVVKQSSNKRVKTEEPDDSTPSFMPKVGLFNKRIRVYEDHGDIKLYVEMDKNEDHAIFMLKDSYSIGIDYKSGRICSDVSLVLPLLDNVEHMEKIHKQVRMDVAMPPVVIQQERKTDFQRQYTIRAAQLVDPNNETGATTNEQGKIIPKPDSAKPTTCLLKPNEIIASLQPDDKTVTIKSLFGIKMEEATNNQLLSIQNQHFLADGLMVAGNVPEPKIIFNLIQEKTALQVEINRIFNIYDGDVAPISQQRALTSYKMQLETMLKELWIAVHDGEDVIVNIPLDFKENI